MRAHIDNSVLCNKMSTLYKYLNKNNYVSNNKFISSSEVCINREDVGLFHKVLHHV